MRAKRRVGRPKSERNKIDLGTVELRKKRAQYLTDEALDLALKRGLVTEEQHQAALRLRWLYCLKFGAPSISAYDPDQYKTGVTRQHMKDETWRKQREKEYEAAVNLLCEIQSEKIVMWVVVFDKRPLCLRFSMRELVAHETFYAKAQKERELLQRGLAELETFFMHYQQTERRMAICHSEACS